MDVLQWSRHYRCFPGQGAFDLAGLRRPRARRRLRRPALARGVQRRLPPGRPGPHRGRRDALAARARGPAARAQRRRSTASRSSRSASTPSRRPRPRRCCARWGSPTSGRTAASRCSCGSTATSASCSTTASATTTPRSWRSRSRAPTPSAPRRAREALLAPVLERRRGAGEADLAAVAAPDGTAVFFCGPDGSWLGDFLALDEPAPDERRADRPHRPHHARPAVRGVRRGRRSSTARCSTCSPGARAELAAPDGLVRSRALAERRPARADRAQRPGARAARGAARPSCSTSRSPAATRSPPRARCASAARRSCRSRTTTTTTSRPGSTLDAGAARRAARARRALRPRRGGGELLHFYSGAVGGRVFFEVLERRGGYDGYGAVNSPVRMAAQRATATGRIGGERAMHAREVAER